LSLSFIIFTKYRNIFLHPLMMLIADSGSTKTTWILVHDENGKHFSINTSGINPMYQDEESIYHLLQKEFIPPLADPVTVYFYGAGCINNAVNETVRNALKRYFNCEDIIVGTDLMAAARSLCQDAEGIACILGTGSNSCYYDGHAIVRNISPLGYMLGDEGSGAVIGRKFIADLLKNQLSEQIRELFFNTYDLTASAIMDHVYKKPFPNRFLAQFTRFIFDHRTIPELSNLVKQNFIQFFERNIRQYDEAGRLPIQFTGSVAYYFSDLLSDAARETGYMLGQVTESPVKGLIRYHKDQIS